MKENLGQSYSIVKINTETNETITLYSCIPNLNHADLLAQLAMCNKQDYELIYITAGWNISINKNHQEEYEEALKLAEQYKNEKYKNINLKSKYESVAWDDSNW